MATTGSGDSEGAVAITGATGYLGRALTQKLIARGHSVRALARPGSAHRVAPGAVPMELNVFDVEALARGLDGCRTVVHLIGTPHPNPSKAQEFRRVDLESARVCVAAAARASTSHFVYVSVAQPAPVMEAYVSARAEAERALLESGLTATILRPWYILGPGHRWPLLLVPLYAIAELIPSMRDGARRLGLVTLAEMTDALVGAIENPPAAGTCRRFEVPQIRQGLNAR